MAPASSLTSPPLRRPRIQPRPRGRMRRVSYARCATSPSGWRDLESALATGHPARSTWELLEWLDLSAFYTQV